MSQVVSKIWLILGDGFLFTMLLLFWKIYVVEQIEVATNVFICHMFVCSYFFHNEVFSWYLPAVVLTLQMYKQTKLEHVLCAGTNAVIF